jgi:hypothetical protein
VVSGTTCWGGQCAVCTWAGWLFYLSHCIIVPHGLTEPRPELAKEIKSAGGDPFAAVIVDPVKNVTVAVGRNHAKTNPLW